MTQHAQYASSTSWTKYTHNDNIIMTKNAHRIVQYQTF